MRNAYEVLFGKPKDRRQLGRSRRRWEEKSKIDVKEIGCRGVDWIHLGKRKGKGEGKGKGKFVRVLW